MTAAYAFYIAPDRFGTNDIKAFSSNITCETDIAVIADTHFGAGFETDDFDKIVDEINSKDVDFVLFLGDLIDNYSKYTKDTDIISQKLSRLRASTGKFAVFGNHDYGGGAEKYYEDIMNKGGFTVLKNQSKNFENIGLRLIGLDDFLLGYGSTEAMSEADSDMYNLVICHEPDIFDKIASYNTDYMLAGHSHGGQINIPYLHERFLPSLGSKYIKGEYENSNSKLYVNPGLGTTKLKARLFAKPEITYLHLSPH